MPHPQGTTAAPPADDFDPLRGHAAVVVSLLVAAVVDFVARRSLERQHTVQAARCPIKACTARYKSENARHATKARNIRTARDVYRCKLKPTTTITAEAPRQRLCCARPPLLPAHGVLL